MSLARFGALREPWWLPSVIAGKVASARRIRRIERTTGLTEFQEFDWTHLVHVIYQLGNSCLAFSAAQCIWLWLSLHGFLPQRFPWPFPIYWYLRRRRTETPKDGGGFAGDCWWAINKFHVAPTPENFTDADMLAGLNGPPPAHIDMAAVSVKVTWGSIYDSGTKLVDRICDSLAKNQPVQICIPVNREILNAPNETVVITPDEALPMGHAVAIVAARKRGGIRQFKVFTNWRRNPFLWLNEEYVGMAYSVRYISRVEGWV